MSNKHFKNLSKIKLHAYFTAYTKFNLRGIIDLKMKTKIIKLLEKNIGEYRGL